MPLKLLIDAFQAMERAATAEDLRKEMTRFARDMGFDHCAYALTINAPSLPAQQYIINGFPQQWVDRYLSKGYFKVDPLIRHAQTNTLPVIWDEVSHQSPKTDEFWAEAKSFGLSAGVSFSVHEQPGVTGIFSLARDQLLDMQGQDLAALIGRAQMFASLLHHAATRIALPKLLPEANTDLTDRERECLRWAADGKTAWEIGKIMGITERTAVFHTNNVIQKLGASNKGQAIVRAMALRLV